MNTTTKPRAKRKLARVLPANFNELSTERHPSDPTPEEIRRRARRFRQLKNASLTPNRLSAIDSPTLHDSDEEYFLADMEQADSILRRFRRYAEIRRLAIA